MFLGKDGVKKLLNGRKMTWTSLIEIGEIIKDQIYPYLEKGMKTASEKYAEIEKKYSQKESNVLTIFYGSEMAEQFMETLAQTIGEQHPLLEISLVPTKETACDIVLAFE